MGTEQIGRSVTDRESPAGIPHFRHLYMLHHILMHGANCTCQNPFDVPREHAMIFV